MRNGGRIVRRTVTRAVPRVRMPRMCVSCVIEVGRCIVQFSVVTMSILNTLPLTQCSDFAHLHTRRKIWRRHIWEFFVETVFLNVKRWRGPGTGRVKGQGEIRDLVTNPITKVTTIKAIWLSPMRAEKHTNYITNCVRWRVNSKRNGVGLEKKSQKVDIIQRTKHVYQIQRRKQE